jgi:signal transduction histidine kinase/ligand-binding sensor domain-containing protein
LAFFFCAVACAQNSPYSFRNLSVNDGLTQNSIWSLLRDRQGFMWIGTADGLNRFDGYSVVTYKRLQGDTTQIRGNNITMIYEDKYGHIWFGHDGGVDVYDPVKDRFGNVFSFPVNRPNQWNAWLAADEPGGDCIWVFLRAKGIMRFDVKTRKMLGAVTGIPADPQKYWFGQRCGTKIYLTYFNTGTFEYDLGTRNVKLVFPYKGTYSRFFIRNGDIYFFENSCFKKYHIATAETSVLSYIPGLRNCNHIDLFRHQFLLTSQSGYAFVDTATFETRYYASLYPDRPKSYNLMAACLFDREQTLWLGTDGKGLFYTSLYANKFRTYRSEKEDENLVKGICTLPGKILVASLYDKGVLVCNLATGERRLLSGAKSFPGAGNSQFTSVAVASSHEVWVSNTEKGGSGLYLVDILTGKGRNYSDLIGRFSHPTSTGPYWTFLMRVDEKLYAINSRVVVEITSHGKAYVSHLLYNSDSTVNTCLYLSKNRKYFFIGQHDGVAVRNMADGSIRELAQNAFIQTKCISEDRFGNYYLATTNGMYVYDSTLHLKMNYTTMNGLIDNFNYAVLPGNDGNMWISHNKGITRYDPVHHTFRDYSVADGLQSNEFNTNAFHVAADGEMFFGGVNGINAFYPREVADNPNKPQLHITGIRLFDEPYGSDSSYWMKKLIRLPYNQNTLSFEFAACEMGNPEKNQYAYMLSGIDTGWIQNGNKRFVRYPNLPPGSYELRVKAANADGAWNESPTTLLLIITPPFWRTIWFYGMLAVAGIGIIVMIIFLITRQQKNRLMRELEVQDKLESERARISRDLHDHVGAQLSYLITNIDWMLEHPHKVNGMDEQERLKSLSDTGRQAILTLRQTIWALNNKALDVEDFADRYKQFALKMMEFNDKVRLHFNETIVENKMLSPGVALNLFRVCQEAFNNCLRHAACTTIDVKFSSDESHVFGFELADNGIGFNVEEASANGHYGLQNMKHRAAESGAVLTIESSEGKGTTVKLVKTA